VATKDEIKESKVRMSEVESKKKQENKLFVNLGKENQHAKKQDQER
jgi:hypothetical protein